jgi:hypothetical protein
MPLFYYTTSSCEQFSLYCEPLAILIGVGVSGDGGLRTDPHPTQLNNSPPTQPKKIINL